MPALRAYLMAASDTAATLAVAWYMDIPWDTNIATHPARTSAGSGMADTCRSSGAVPIAGHRTPGGPPPPRPRYRGVRNSPSATCMEVVALLATTTWVGARAPCTTKLVVGVPNDPNML